jgi:predicted HTH transcriptional regulator
MKAIPTQELYRDGVRSMEPIYPDTAVRELIANALIHQDFTISGVGPVVDMYADRLEVTNPGHSLIEVDRIVDERRSRNEKLAAEMRSLGLCEERGGGIDKALLEIERRCAPPPDFVSSKDSMRVVVFSPKPFNELTKSEKRRACFFHCILGWIKSDYMTNTSLRERFMLQPTDYQLVSAIISEAVKMGRIVAADPAQGRKHAKYVPYWVK